ncbi:MAG TPA: hypothetical protein VF364_09515 [Candidatus Limnocylindria bacterium]
MRAHATTGRRSVYGEDAEAAIRALLGLTIAVGGVLSIMAVATDGLPVTAVPTLALLTILLARAPIEWAAWAALAVWLVLLPATPLEALVAPVSMVAICLAVALGPERMLAWLARDATASPASEAGPQDGWIEEEPHRIG